MHNEVPKGRAVVAEVSKDTRQEVKDLRSIVATFLDTVSKLATTVSTLRAGRRAWSQSWSQKGRSGVHSGTLNGPYDLLVPPTKCTIRYDFQKICSLGAPAAVTRSTTSPYPLCRHCVLVNMAAKVSVFRVLCPNILILQRLRLVAANSASALTDTGK